MLTGDFAQLDRLSRKIADLSQMPSRVSAKAAPEFTTAIQQEFSAGKDPYGAPWASLSAETLRKGRSAPPLTDTGRMRASARAEAAGKAGIAVHIAPPAIFLQAKRPMVPALGVEPPRWREILESTARQDFASTMRGA